MNTPTNIYTERVDITVADGSQMGGYLARPTSDGPHPGVIVAMELFGVSAHVRDVCERVASLGYLALAPDFHHRIAPGGELAEDEDGRARGFELLHQMTRPQVLADVHAAMAYLHTERSPKVGMIGLSVGGHIAYLAATEFDLAAVVVAYGGWIPTTDIPMSQPDPTIARTAGITARMLMLVGELDHVVPAEHRRAIADALRTSSVEHQVVEYPGAPHGFLCGRRDTFNPEAAANGWGRIEHLFRTALQ